MVKHSGGKVGKAGKTLSSRTAPKAHKPAAARTLSKHKLAKH